MDKPLISQTLNKLNNLSEDSLKKHVFVGLDGFIDAIQRPVKSKSEAGPEYFSTIKDFALSIGNAAGKSAQYELVTQQTKLGGNAPIMAHAMGSLGYETTCIGNFGKNTISEVFQDIHKNVNLISLGNAALTSALEFNDGKIILSEMGPLNYLTWNDTKGTAGLNKIIDQINSSELVALVDWCNLEYSTEIWRGILDEVLPELDEKNKHFFFDIADPSRRSDEALKEALEVIGGYNEYGQVTLGLNENETEKVYAGLKKLNGETDDKKNTLVDKGSYIFEKIKVWNLLIHPTDRTISINKQGISEVQGRFVAKPKISTGGGDNFNAGYCLGQLIGLNIEESMITGMANSGAYVQNGQSCSLHDLKTYLEIWISEIQ